jgi:pimeloyl-ACP methyl ester carboxylesterase
VSTVGTQYAKAGDVHIAYQVVGDGPIDLVMVPGFVSHLECYWEEPSLARFLRRLAGFCRLILFDKRGTGLSDRLTGMPTLEHRMDDVRAVMDATHSNRAAILGISEGGALSAVFAATYPNRTSHLMLYGAFAEFASWFPTARRLAAFFHYCETGWGSGDSLRGYAPSLVDDAAFKQWWGRYERQGASPGAAAAMMKMNAEIDVKHVLPSIRVPTLVMHRIGDVAVSVEAGRYLAAHIPGAKYVELPGVDHPYWVGDTDSVLDQVQEFLTGTRGAADVDRVLATVLFTDVVASTRTAVELGDRRWAELLVAYHGAVRNELSRFRGREIDTAGDGVFAAFDGPARAIRCACAVHDAAGQLGLDIRTGLHTGECESLGNKIGGLAVHIGARVAAEARLGEILVSNTVKDLVAGSGISFGEGRTVQLKGVPGEWRLYAVER